MSDNLNATRAAFATAMSAEEYHAAKRMAGRMNRAAQFAVVDCIIACRRRLEASGVL